MIRVASEMQRRDFRSLGSSIDVLLDEQRIGEILHSIRNTVLENHTADQNLTEELPGNCGEIRG